ncbi:acetate--CoA ligase family protein [Tissierella praeacuta]|uniref:acetate--CoA ligase family protein n=1 Tax=Tissierella praeacuta TaxID=43131 RepID=UPI003DA6341A
MTRRNLNELEANQLLSSIGISMAKTVLCTSSDETLKVAEEIGFPVVLKILSPDILHKTEAGCVKVGIGNNDDLVKGYEEIINNAKNYNPHANIKGVILQKMLPKGLELIFGISKDPQFGYTIMFGMGGIYVEVYQDIALRLVPINKEEALKMIDETKISKILKGARGKQYDINEVVDILLKLSDLVVNRPEIEEVDINPFILYEKGVAGSGADALITLEQ